MFLEHKYNIRSLFSSYLVSTNSYHCNDSKRRLKLRYQCPQSSVKRTKTAREMHVIIFPLKLDSCLLSNSRSIGFQGLLVVFCGWAWIFGYSDSRLMDTYSYQFLDLDESFSCHSQSPLLPTEALNILLFITPKALKPKRLKKMAFSRPNRQEQKQTPDELNCGSENDLNWTVHCYTPTKSWGKYLSL